MEPMREETLDQTVTAPVPEADTAAAGPSPAPAALKAEYRMIAFSLSGRDYGIDIMKVKEISHEGKFTYVPNTAPYVLGVHNLRGEIIPVIDLRRLFNLPVAETKGELNVLILQLSKMVLGVVVDTVDGVMGAPADSVQPPHPIFDDINIQYIHGIVEKDGKLIVILDVERIFQESAQPAKPVKAAAVMAHAPAAAVKKGNQDFAFVCEGLATFASFHVSPLNMAWVEKRFSQWSAARKKMEQSVQLGGAEDAREFLSTFASAQRTELWTDAQRSAFVSLLPRPSGSFVAWNHGCGRGFDAYSLVCTLKGSFPDLQVKVLANDGNLVEIASAPALTLPQDKTPRFYMTTYMKATQGGWQFNQEIKDRIIFEYTESLERMETLEADLIIARDILSYQKPDAQKAVLEMFADRLKPGGILLLGVNEQIDGQGWRAIEKGGARAFVRETPKE